MSYLRFRLHSLLILAAVLAIPVVAEASILEGALTDGINTFNDKDRERLLKGVNPITGAPNTQAGVIEVGDILESILVFDSIENGFGNFNVDSVPGLAGLTAHSRILVTSVTPQANPLIADFVFAAGFGDGAAVRVYEGSSLTQPTDFDSGTAASQITMATDGTFLFDLVFDGIDDFWIADGPINLANLLLRDAFFQLGLSVGSNPGNIPIVADAMPSILSGPLTLHDVTGLGTAFFLTQPNAPGWGAQTDTTIRFVAAIVPEASSFATWALLVGGCAVVVAARRKR